MTRIVAAFVLSAFLATPALAQTASTPERDQFAQAVLGWCFKQIVGAPLIPSTLDPSGPDWADAQAVETTGSLRLFNARSLVGGKLLVDVAPNKTSCFVQTENVAARAWAEGVRADLKARPGGTLLDEKSSPEAHSTVYAILPQQDRGRVPIIVVHDYDGRMRNVVTAVVTMGDAQPRTTSPPLTPQSTPTP